MKYFPEQYKDVVYGSFNISREAIDPQPNDPIVDKIVSIFEDMGFRSKDSDPLLPTPQRDKIQSGLKEISKLLKERFGIVIYVIDTNEKNFYTYPLNLKITNVLSRALLWIPGSIQETINDNQTDESKIIERRLSSEDDNVITKTWAMNFKNALKDSRLNNVTIDLKKAYINNMPEIYRSYILLGIKHAHGLNLTAREMTAVLFHEYGHNFTMVENTYRCIQNTTILLDNLRQEVGKKGKTVRSALKLTYEKIFKESVPASATSEQILLDWLEQEMKLISFSTNKYAFTDTEALADQFPTRFGLGPDIISSLNKLSRGATHSNVGEPILMLDAILLYMSMSGVTVGILLALGITGAAGGVIAGISMFIYKIIIYLYLNGSDFETDTIIPYDVFYKRYQRVKLDLIRQIRTVEGVDSKFKNKLIEDIEEVEKHLKNIKFPSTSLMQKLIRILSDNKRRAFDMKRSQQLMEELSENDLYVASGKLQQFV